MRRAQLAWQLPHLLRRIAASKAAVTACGQLKALKRGDTIQFKGQGKGYNEGSRCRHSDLKSNTTILDESLQCACLNNNKLEWKRCLRGSVSK
eukprot:4312811-Amphidinium_carterae.1